MRTASLVLGIVGGVLAIIFGIVSFVTAATLDVFTPSNLDSYMDDFSDALEQYDDGNFNYNFDYDYGDGWSAAATVTSGVATYYYVAGALGLVGGVLGIIGGAFAKKKNVMAGVFMIVACVLSSMSGWGLFGGIPLLIGGILALVKEKKPQPAGAYPYPPYQQPPQSGPYNYQRPPQPGPYNYQQPPQPQNPQYPQYPQNPPAPPVPPAPPQEPQPPQVPQQ